jgi:hypothetical protein
VDASTLAGGLPAKEPVPIEPILVSGMAYAKIIDGMMNVGFYRDQATPDGGSERVIVAKLMFLGNVQTVIRAILVNQAMLDGAVREEVQRRQDSAPMPPEPQRATTKRVPLRRSR